MSSRKRANVFDEEDAQVGRGGHDAKKLKSSKVSFLPPKEDLKNLPTGAGNNARLPSNQNQRAAVTSQAPSVQVPEDVAAKRAMVAAKFAKMRTGPGPLGGSLPSSLPSSSTPAPESPSLPGRPTQQTQAPSTSPTPAREATPEPAARPNIDPDLAKKVAEAKKMVEQMNAQRNANPYLPSPPVKPSKQLATSQPPTLPGKSGLSMAVHPLLMQQANEDQPASKSNRYKPMLPKFATTKANTRLPQAPSPKQPPQSDQPPSDSSFTDPRLNPYFDPTLGRGIDGAEPKERGGRRAQLKFNQKGKWIRLAEQMRAEARMEELKQRILESAKKAGFEDDLEMEGRRVRRAPPPETEWWDGPFLPNKSYSDIDSGLSKRAIMGEVSGDKVVSEFIQHPIPIPAPGDKNKPPPRPTFLTKKEQKKMRRMRRQAELKEKQDRVRMGLLPPDPPKVKLSNMMRVLTQQAVADPTKVEMQVAREMMARKRGHDKANQQRKLTDDERRSKIEKKKEEDEKKGISAAAFKIRYLSNPSHKFKVRRNADQLNLTGVTIFSPKFNLVLVEGGAKGIKAYTKLMVNRIDWTQEAIAREGDEAEGADEGGEGGPSTNGGLSLGEEQESISMADNTCELVWEGQLKDRTFKTFRPKNCPTDQMAKDFLGNRWQGVWDLAKATKEDTIGV